MVCAQRLTDCEWAKYGRTHHVREFFFVNSLVVDGSTRRSRPLEVPSGSASRGSTILISKECHDDLMKYSLRSAHLMPAVCAGHTFRRLTITGAGAA